MTRYRELWEPPDAASLKAGQAAIERAKAAGAKTDRERGYIAALEIFYKDYEKIDHPTRAQAYARAMEELSARFPDDREAAAFYSLALRATASPTDNTYAVQKKAGAIAEKLFAEQPDHPGLAHYIIHCYDYPLLAQLALPAARRYAKIAADSPHAQHMPSHIFTRLGLWQDSIQSNLASAATARKHGDTGDELHAQDYLAYAYLQSGQDRKAAELIRSIPRTQKAYSAYFAGLYASALIPARYALEHRRWEDAAKLEIPEGLFPGGRYAGAEANLYFARALGAARTRNLEHARQGMQKLESLRQVLLENKDPYWAGQVDIQRQTVAAWVAFADGNKDDAVTRMRSAADAEDATDKHPVTPGVVRPARELLADMLLELEKPAEALREFEAVLKGAPNRFNALYGAARAANLAGNKQKASEYYAKLVEVCAPADTERSELAEAKAFLAKNGRPRAAQ